MGRLVVATWNLQFGVEIDRAIDVIAGHPVVSDVDLLLMQELDGDGAERIGAALGFDVAYRAACRHPQTGRDFGNAVFTRGPQADECVVDLPHRAAVQGTPRLALGVRGEVREVAVSGWCTHTETPALTRAKRVAQFQTFADAVAADGAEVLVAGGDFNTVTRRGVGTVTTIMEAARTTRIVPEPSGTLRRGGQSLTLDHLFVRGLGVRECGVMSASGASDHDAVWAELEVERR